MSIRKWFQRREHRLAIKQAFHITKSIIFKCSMRNRNELLACLQEMLNDYETEHGNDNFSIAYKEQLEFMEKCI